MRLPLRKEKIKILLDYLPLLILGISAAVLVGKLINEQTGLLWKHIVGLLFLPVNFALFLWRHKIGVMALGLTLLLGLAGLLSYSHAITTVLFFLGRSEGFYLPLFYGQPVFLLWLLLHFVVSGRHYAAMTTKKYWKDLLTKSKISPTRKH